MNQLATRTWLITWLDGTDKTITGTSFHRAVVNNNLTDIKLVNIQSIVELEQNDGLRLNFFKQSR